MVKFTVQNVPERYVACRLAMMMAGNSGPLAWEEVDDPCATTIPTLGANGWDLGDRFLLTRLGEFSSEGETYDEYQLTHPELDRELLDMQAFLEWVFATQHQ